MSNDDLELLVFLLATVLVLVVAGCIWLIVRNRELEDDNHTLRLQNRRLRVKAGEGSPLEVMQEAGRKLGEAFNNGMKGAK